MFGAIGRGMGKVAGYFAKSRGSVKATNEQLLNQLAMLRASYDAARTTDEFKNYWANTDQFDADSAHDPNVRQTLVARSRYEINSNGYSDGIAQTYATDLVGKGPTLRMQSGSDGFNRMVEAEWARWCKAVKLRRLLWCMAHAKHSDGEAIAVIRKNPRINHPVQLCLMLYETEQCATPGLMPNAAGYIDGIKFDEFGNPIWYDILPQHPGASRQFTLNMTPERVRADRVLHWFKLRRPGQHRAVPEMASTLPTGAAARRWRESHIAAAETASDLTLLMKTQLAPDEADAIAPFSTMDVSKRMMGFLPAGWDPFQPDAKFPTSNYESFHQSLISEQARPKSMPKNKAMCDSSSYNYASGRLDHQTYYGSLDTDREDGNDLVLEPLFDVWFDFAVVAFGWLGGNPEAVSPAAKEHVFDWPKHRVADEESDANANETKLTSGQVFLHRLFSDAGMDLTDEITTAAEMFGVTEDEIRQRLLDITLPAAQAASAAPDLTHQQATQDAVTAIFRDLERRRQSTAVKPGVANGN